MCVCVCVCVCVFLSLLHRPFKMMTACAPSAMIADRGLIRLSNASTIRHKKTVARIRQRLLSPVRAAIDVNTNDGASTAADLPLPDPSAHKKTWNPDTWRALPALQQPQVCISYLGSMRQRISFDMESSFCLPFFPISRLVCVDVNSIRTSKLWKVR